MDQKKYGLIRLSKTDKHLNALKKNIFDSDSDDETQQSDRKKISTSSGIRRQTQLDISRALTEDPNVFEYDSVYDDMKSKKEAIVAIDSEAKEKPKPKYINSLLKFSENRKKENERRVERKIQKERESEGNQFEDKEQFVTNAYKEKINEMKAEEERDRRQEAIEELLDVKKQKDLSGFYRHLLNNDISSEKKDSTLETTDSPQEIAKPIPKPKTNRQIRKRKSSSEESSDESPQTLNTKVLSKEELKEPEISKKNTESDKESEDNQSEDEKPSNDSNIKQEVNSEDLTNETAVNKELKKEENKIPKLNKRELLIKIFTKRNVGQVFTEAQMRYFQRKNNYVI